MLLYNISGSHNFPGVCNLHLLLDLLFCLLVCCMLACISGRRDRSKTSHNFPGHSSPLVYLCFYACLLHLWLQRQRKRFASPRERDGGGMHAPGRL